MKCLFCSKTLFKEKMKFCDGIIGYLHEVKAENAISCDAPMCYDCGKRRGFIHFTVNNVKQCDTIDHCPICLAKELDKPSIFKDEDTARRQHQALIRRMSFRMVS